ncbi:MAG: FIST C-terminal domain-containing protein [Chitinophagaceae bacterium]|nr:FIST C-terminal domain-containing protein [Chitinophagaceae bacterium]
MKITCSHLPQNWEGPSGVHSAVAADDQAQLVLVFGTVGMLQRPELAQYLRSCYPQAQIAYASTAGEIFCDEVLEHSVVINALRFDQTQVEAKAVNVADFPDSYSAGKHLRSQFADEGLQLLFVLSDGTLVNGSDLVKGLNEGSDADVLITGGLAGDDAQFKQTLTGLNEAIVPGMIVAIGLYGQRLQIGHGSMGGWDEFGPLRCITRSHKNELFEVDGKNALDLYKAYLGAFSKELPKSALLFPLSLQENGSQHKLVRTILQIDEEKKSMLFAGNMPEGSHVRLMKANFDRLIEAADAAAASTLGQAEHPPVFAVLVSCVGRRLILQERVYEEVKAARRRLGQSCVISGFYSYGEISPFHSLNDGCELHNQTMTITTLAEV